MSTYAPKQIALFILKVAVAAALVTALVLYIDVEALVASLSRANALLLASGFALIIVNIGIHFLRWRYLLRLVSSDISNEETFVSLLVGLTAGFFTPGQIGEFAGRIASHPDLRKTHIVGISIIDKLYLLALTIIIGIIALAAFVYIYFHPYWLTVYGIGAAAAAAVLTYLCANPVSVKRFFTFIPRRFREHSLYSIVEIIEAKFHNAQGRALYLLTGSLYVCIFLQYYIFAAAFEPVGLLDSLMCSASVYFVKAVVLPFSIGDLGVRESAAIFFFSRAGFSAASAFNASMCMFLSNLVIPSLIGSFLIIRLKVK